MLVFDTSDTESFLHINEWMSKVKKCGAQQISSILIGNNSGDRARAVTKEQAQSYAEKHLCKYYEVKYEHTLKRVAIYSPYSLKCFRWDRSFRRVYRMYPNGTRAGIRPTGCLSLVESQY